MPSSEHGEHVWSTLEEYHPGLHIVHLGPVEKPTAAGGGGAVELPAPWSSARLVASPLASGARDCPANGAP